MELQWNSIVAVALLACLALAGCETFDRAMANFDRAVEKSAGMNLHLPPSAYGGYYGPPPPVMTTYHFPAAMPITCTDFGNGYVVCN